jgi:hypothetical protein
VAAGTCTLHRFVICSVHCELLPELNKALDMHNLACHALVALCTRVMEADQWAWHATTMRIVAHLCCTAAAGSAAQVQMVLGSSKTWVS